MTKIAGSRPSDRSSRLMSTTFHTGIVQILGPSSDDEMVAVFLRGELSSERFGGDVRARLVSCGQSERLLTCPNLADPEANAARRQVLAATRGYGEDRELFIDFPAHPTWVRAVLCAGEIATVRYMDYSYWYEISGGSRVPADAAARIRAGIRAWGVPNTRFTVAAAALARGEQFPPLILVGEDLQELVCLEGHLRLTAHALAGFPIDVECLVGTAPTMGRWTQLSKVTSPTSRNTPTISRHPTRSMTTPPAAQPEVSDGIRTSIPSIE